MRALGRIAAHLQRYAVHKTGESCGGEEIRNLRRRLRE